MMVKENRTDILRVEGLRGGGGGGGGGVQKKGGPAESHMDSTRNIEHGVHQWDTLSH